MSQHKRNDELTDATIQPYPPKEPNAESIEAIHEGNASLPVENQVVSATPPT